MPYDGIISDNPVYMNEYPQIMFTVQSIAQELRDRVDFEILVVDNTCPESDKQPYEKDKSGEVMKGSVRVNQPWLKYLNYTNKLSHWQSKNFGVQHSTGEFLWFCDSHCIIARDALYNMFCYYKEHHEELNGSIHLPLTYKILESRKTMYKLVVDHDRAWYHYSLTGYRHEEAPYEVPAVSTCGMLMTRKLYNELGGWPVEMGIYGGGENFTNFTKAVMGKKKWMFPGNALHHHGEKRGYHSDYTDTARNRCIATYMFGGRELAAKMIQNTKGSQDVLQAVLQDVFTKCAKHRERIKQQQVIDVISWCKEWV